MFLKHAARFVSIVFMVLIAVGFVSGIGTATDKINYSLVDYYKAQNVSDFIVKCTGEGFTEADVAAVAALFADEKSPASIETGLSLDYERTYRDEEGREKRETVRLYFLDSFSRGEWSVNVPRVGERASAFGTPENIPEKIAYAERADNVLRGYSLKEEIKLDFTEISDGLSRQGGGEGLSEQEKSTLSALFSPVTVTVTETVSSPLTFALDGEPGYVQEEGTEVSSIDTLGDLEGLNCLDNILYLSSDVIPTYPAYVPEKGGSRLLSTGDIYIASGERSRFDPFGKNYEKYVAEKTEQIERALSENGVTYAKVITLYDNVSFSMLYSYAEKVEGIGWVLMVAFLLVMALVTVSDMTRLLEEERSQIACLKTLGYSSFRIVFKYALFALIATGIGGVGACFVGMGLANLLYYVFNFSFVMPPMSAYFAMPFYLAVLFSVVAVILLSTVFSGLKMTREAPAELLRPRPPKAGKKVIVEKIPFLWKRLSFKYKSTVRNVLRYKSRFWMTVLSVAFSTALVMAGLGILDLCLFGGLSSPSIIAVAVVVIAFAGLLTATVVYTLTSINISERNRELATLMVLGYHDGEVAGYIYREIFIDTLIGIVLGYPFSALLVGMVFNVIGIGTLGGIRWFMWLIAPPAVLLFGALVALFLRRKIARIDMNESLKAIE